MLAAVLLASIAAQGTPLSVSVANVTVIGLSEDQDRDAKGKIDEEIAALGATVFPGPVVEADCVPDPECLKNAMKDSGAIVWVYFEAIRVGPVVQISSTLYDNQAQTIAEGNSTADPDAFPGEGSILPEAVREKLKALAAEHAPAPAATETVEIKPPPAKEPPKVGGAKGGMTMIQTAGLVVGGLGIVVGAVGGILAAHEIATLEDPKSLGTDKERARALAWVGLGGAVLGVAAVGGGAGMYLLDFE